ncbi:MAG: DUF5343 domain-containing protein [Pseudomonadota bacterium]
MTLPSQYLTSQKNLAAVFEAIRQAKAPEKFTVKFLEGLGFKSNSDRLIIGLLKALRFLDESGKPQERYFEFLDDTRWEKVLGTAVEEAYADLFQVNTSAHTLTKTEVINKFKTLSQGAYSESVLDKMGMTFTALAKLGDFSSSSSPPPTKDEHDGADDDSTSVSNGGSSVNFGGRSPKLNMGGLHYNIQIILPESRDPKVYDALFRSLREHLVE